MSIVTMLALHAAIETVAIANNETVAQNEAQLMALSASRSSLQISAAKNRMNDKGCRKRHKAREQTSQK